MPLFYLKNKFDFSFFAKAAFTAAFCFFFKEAAPFKEGVVSLKKSFNRILLYSNA
jgi:hypothetical protein